MKYMGSKARFAKEILPLILKNRKPDQWYVEPFCGGCNVIDKVTGNRLANDANRYLIAMWKSLILGWIPQEIDRTEYDLVCDKKEDFCDHIVGWTGFNVSYGGKFFGGFAGKTNTKIGTVRDYQAEAIKNILKQVPNLMGTVFFNLSYNELQLPAFSIVYCDPPYAGTTGYNGGFNHESFWNWVRKTSKEHEVYVSEYNAPDDFECIWSKTAKSSLSANGKIGGNKESVERLFVCKK